MYLLDWSSSLPLSFMAELSRGDPDHPAQRPFQASQVTKSRHGPSREKLPWAPPAHTAFLVSGTESGLGSGEEIQGALLLPAWLAL